MAGANYVKLSADLAFRGAESRLYRPIVVGVHCVYTGRQLHAYYMLIFGWHPGL